MIVILVSIFYTYLIYFGSNFCRERDRMRERERERERAMSLRFNIALTTQIELIFKSNNLDILKNVSM